MNTLGGVTTLGTTAAAATTCCSCILLNNVCFSVSFCLSLAPPYVQARDASGSTAVVAVITPQHVIVANAGDSRAILIMVPLSDRNGASKREPQAMSGRTNNSSLTALSRGQSDGEEKDEIAAAVAQRFAASLGLNVSNDDNGGLDERGDLTDSPGAADAAGLNDSVRLDELEEDDKEAVGGIGDLGIDDADAAKIRNLLAAMMSRDSPGASPAEDAGEDSEAARNDGGCGGHKEGRGSGIEVLTLSRDHTAADEREKERVEAAGGRSFEVCYTESDGTDAKVRAC